MKDYQIISADEATDSYADSDVPGEFRKMTDKLGASQVAVTLIKVPAHSDFEQGTGHHHSQVEEVYIITKGILTMRFGDDIVKVPAGNAARVAPQVDRSHRNEGGEPVEMWAVSIKSGKDKATHIKDFWPASPKAKQKSS